MPITHWRFRSSQYGAKLLPSRTPWLAHRTIHIQQLDSSALFALICSAILFAMGFSIADIDQYKDQTRPSGSSTYLLYRWQEPSRFWLAAGIGSSFPANWVADVQYLSTSSLVLQGNETIWVTGLEGSGVDLSLQASILARPSKRSKWSMGCRVTWTMLRSITL